MIASLTQWISDFFHVVIEWFFNLFIDFFQLVIDTFSDAALIVVDLFPASPAPVDALVTPSGTIYNYVIGIIGWILPVSYLASLLVFLFASIAAYFIIAPLARWFKLLT